VLEYERQMDKILEDQENATVVTNPHDRLRAFLHKLTYRWQLLRERFRRAGRRGERP